MNESLLKQITQDIVGRMGVRIQHRTEGRDKVLDRDHEHFSTTNKMKITRHVLDQFAEKCSIRLEIVGEDIEKIKRELYGAYLEVPIEEIVQRVNQNTRLKSRIINEQIK